MHPAPSNWGHFEQQYQYFFPGLLLDTTSASGRGSRAASSALLTEALRLSALGGTEVTSSSSSEVSEWSSSSTFLAVGAVEVVALLVNSRDT